MKKFGRNYNNCVISAPLGFTVPIASRLLLAFFCLASANEKLSHCQKSVTARGSGVGLGKPGEIDARDSASTSH